MRKFLECALLLGCALVLLSGCSKSERYRDYNEGVPVPSEPPIGGGGSGYMTEEPVESTAGGEKTNAPSETQETRTKNPSPAKPEEPPTEQESFD